ncbi:MAG: hypothetical protein NVS3B25_30030 [Hymenobacter sp.]
MTLTANNKPLPVELTRFDATATATGTSLAWATASEKNSAYFEVQRSANSENFQTIATVQGQGTSATAHEYAVLDRAPLAGLAYYRLHQVDKDGAATYSPVVTARRAEAAALAVYPNPSSDKLYLSGLDAPATYRVLNSQGKIVLTGETDGAAGVDLKRLPAGIYLLETGTGAARHVQRFVRQ